MSLGDIVQLNFSDLAELKELAQKTFFDTFAKDNTAENMQFYLENNLSEAQIKSELENPNSYFYGIRKDKKLIAYLKLNDGGAQTDSKLNNAMEIERIYVDKDYLGQKLGKRLFEFSVQRAQKLEKQCLWLGVWSQNYYAIEFYERQGFIKFAEHAFHLGSEEQVDYLYKMSV